MLLGLHVAAAVLDKKKRIGPVCFFDIAVDGQSKGRVIFQLDSQNAPKACENFRQFCVGNMRNKKGGKLHYKGNLFHGIHSYGAVFVGGDTFFQSGRGGESIYGTNFTKEDAKTNFLEAGTLGMLTHPEGMHTSQFFILLHPHSNLEKHTAFGRVIEGMELLRRLTQVGDSQGQPITDVSIQDCGQFNYI